MTLNEALALARKKTEDGRHDEAEQIYEQILASWPNNAEVLYVVSMSILQHGDAQGAESLLRKATTLAPSKAKYFSGLGHSLKAQGKQEECTDVCEH